MNINELFQAAEKADGGSGGGDLLTAADLPNGTEVLCQITYSKEGEKDGVPRWTNKLTILEGDLEGGEFFDGIYLSGKTSDGAVNYNKRQFAKIQATGMGAQFFSTDPSSEAIAKAMKDSKVIVKIKWQKQTEEQIAEGKDPFGEHVWSPASSAPAGGPAGFSGPSGFGV